MALVSKNFSDIITFSRASAATRVNASGLVESVAANTPRFDYDPITLAARGILIEEQRTNISTYSEHLAAWPASNAFVVPNATTAPDGSFDAVKLVENTTASAQHFAYQNYALGAGTYAQSVYVKAGERTRFMFNRTDTGGFSAFFNLSTGTVISSTGFTSVTLTAVGNGWYRASAVLTLASSSTVGFGLETLDAAGSASYTGDGTSGLFLWGAQFEAGSFATSYIPSTTTFTGRSSTGTFIGANGLIQTAASGVARYQYNPANLSVAPFLLLEAAATNLLTYSQDFDNAAWNKGTTGFTLTPNAATSPDGTLTADLYTRGATTAYAYLNQNISGNANQSLTFSCWVRTVSGSSTIQMSISDVSLATANSSFISIDETWKRISFSITAGQLSNTGTVGVGFLMSNGQTAYFWGAQLEAGSYPTSYIPSTVTFTGRSSTGTFIGSNGLIQTASSGVARYQYNPANLSAPPFLLLEESRTNLLTYSEQFDNAVWAKSALGVSANTAIAPDGNSTADSAVPDTTTALHYAQDQAFTLTGTTTYTASFYVKAAGYNWFSIEVLGFQNAYVGSAAFNLSTGAATFNGRVTATNNVACSAVSVGNGWYRCILTCTTDSSAGALSTPRVQYLVDTNGTWNSFAGNGTSGIFIWGAQLEAGSYPTSYIPTTTATVTRAADTSTSATTTRAADTSTSSQTTRSADVASVNTLSPWFNAAEGTLYTEFSAIGLNSQTPGYNQGVASFFGQSGFADSITTHAAIAGTLASRSLVYSGSVIQAEFQHTLVLNTTRKIASAYKANDFASSLNGAAAITDTSGTVPSGITTFSIGRDYGDSARSINGYIRSLRYFPRRLSNTELQTLTS